MAYRRNMVHGYLDGYRRNWPMFPAPGILVQVGLRSTSSDVQSMKAFSRFDGKLLHSLRPNITTQKETATIAPPLSSIFNMSRPLSSLTYTFSGPNQAAVHLPNVNVPLSAPPCPVTASLSFVPGHHITTMSTLIPQQSKIAVVWSKLRT